MATAMNTTDNPVFSEPHNRDAFWYELSERLKSAEIASDVYDAINLNGLTVAGLGLWYYPHDVLGIQLAHAVGPLGKVFIIDPQGHDLTVEERAEYVHGEGNVEKLINQCRRLANAGFPLGEMEWAEDSHLNDIPDFINPTLIAEHGTIDYLRAVLDDGEIVNGVANILSTIPVGGVWIHHSNRSGFLEGLPGIADVDLGVRILRVHLQSDSYSFTLPRDVVERIKLDGRWQYFQAQYDRDAHGERVQTAKLTLPFNKQLMYPKEWVYVVQKIEER